MNFSNLYGWKVAVFVKTEAVLTVDMKKWY